MKDPSCSVGKLVLLYATPSSCPPDWPNTFKHKQQTNKHTTLTQCHNMAGLLAYCRMFNSVCGCVCVCVCVGGVVCVCVLHTLVISCTVKCCLFPDDVASNGGGSMVLSSVPLLLLAPAVFMASSIPCACAAILLCCSLLPPLPCSLGG